MRLGADRLWLSLALVLPALASLLVPLPAVDLAYQVRAGDLILEARRIPVVDTFTFTVAGLPWTDQQWLAQVLLAGGYRLGGWELLAVVRAQLVVIALTFVAATALARGASARTAAVLALLAFGISAPALALRPQLLGIAIFAALGWAVATRAANPRRLLLVPLLVALWANVHGSVVLAPVLLGYAWLDDLVRGRDARASLLALLAGTAATLVNPYGIGVWQYAIGIGADPLIASQVSEWQRSTPFTVPGLLFYLSLVAALAVAIRGRAALRWPDWLWLASLAVIGAWTIRGIGWWPIGATGVVAACLATRTGGVPDGEPKRLNALIVGVAIISVVAALPWWRPSDPLTGRTGLLTYAPPGLATALRREIEAGGRVFAPQAWASWLEWAVPDARYFIDSRFELFPADVWRDYDTVIAGGASADPVLDRWAVDALVTSVDGAQPAAGWTVAFRDDDGAILVRARDTAQTGRWYLRAAVRSRWPLVESAYPGEEWLP